MMMSGVRPWAGSPNLIYQHIARIDFLDPRLVQHDAVVLEEGDGLTGLALIGEPDQRDVVGSLLSHLDAAGGQQVDRIDNVGMARQQSRVGAAFQHMKLADVDRRLAMLCTDDNRVLWVRCRLVELLEHLAHDRVIDEVE